MEFLFGKKKTPEEMLKQNQRALNRAMRLVFLKCSNKFTSLVLAEQYWRSM